MAENAVLERPSFELAYDVAVDEPFRSAEARSVREAPQAEREFTSSLDDGATPGDARSWLKPFLDRITYLSALGLDPRDSQPLNADDRADALEFLLRVMHEGVPSPWIGRLNSGGLQLSWNQGDVEVEAVFDRTRGEKLVMVTRDDDEQDVAADEADGLFASVAERLLPTSHGRRSAS
jgi:hypothetical protein